jgi:hypothetical protein
VLRTIDGGRRVIRRRSSEEEKEIMPDGNPKLTVEGLTELHRRTKDTLALALAAGAPFALLEKLAAATGLVEALFELPKHALIPDVVARAQRALGAWQEWQKRKPRTAAA